MKKLLSISLLVSVLFLYGCSTSNQISADQLFEKKQECASYENDILKKEQSGMIEDASAKMDFTLESIFYSPKENSCLYAVNQMLISKGNISDNYYWFLIKDALTSEIIYTSSMISKENMSIYDEKEMEFKNKIIELKGE